MDTKITFVKANGMVDLACSLEERTTTNEYSSRVPPLSSCGRLQKGSDD